MKRIKPVPTTLLLTLVLCVAALPQIAATRQQQSQPSPTVRQPNVIFILSDDMGYADIGSYGAKDISTPNLDRLAREGVRLTNCYSNGPVCTPTRAGFVTGRYQQRVGLEWALVPADKDAGLPTSETSIARMLKGNGYQTALFGKWHLGFKPEFNPTAHGFDEFYGILGGNVDMYSHRNSAGTPDLYEKTQSVTREGYLTNQITERAITYINKHKSDPFFMYVPYNAVHWPFQVPGTPNDVRNRETWFDGTRRDYKLMLEGMDQGVGQILTALDRENLTRDTLIIFTNDNGGERLSINAPLAHRKGTLWEGGIRVPCLARWTGHLPAGTVSDQPAITMDWTATILAATNTTPPAGRQLDGINLLPMLQGRATQVERTLFWRITRDERKQKAVRRGKWKLLRDGNIELLFDLEKDAGERHDVGYENQNVLKELRGLLAGWDAEMNRSNPPFSVK